MATTTGVIDTAALVRSATWGGDIVRKAIVAHLDAAANELRAERDGYMESGDAMGDHMHIARVVENVERLRDEVATASLVPPAAPQWLDAPPCDGLWWRADASGDVEMVSVFGRDLGDDDGALILCVATLGCGDDERWRAGVCVAGHPGAGPHKWLRVDVPEAPR